MEEEYKLGNTIQEFEELFGNTPFENIEKIKKYIFQNFIPISVIQNKKSEIGSTFDMREEWYTKQYIIELLDEILEKGNK